MEQELTKEAVELFINEVKQVCEKHGLALIGSCNSEGIYSEISIDRLENAPDDRTVSVKKFLGDWCVEVIK